MESIIDKISLSNDLRLVCDKIMSGSRITPDECLTLFKQADLGLLGVLANHTNYKKNNGRVCFIRNFHIEPTNICIYNCEFCSYSQKATDIAWDYTHEEMLQKVAGADPDIREVHITGGVHPHHDIHYYGNLIMEIKKIRPDIHVKAYSAIEIDYMIKKAGLSYEDGLKILKQCGLDSIPGGGAEIFDETLR